MLHTPADGRSTKQATRVNQKAVRSPEMEHRGRTKPLRAETPEKRPPRPDAGHKRRGPRHGNCGQDHDLGPRRRPTRRQHTAPSDSNNTRLNSDVTNTARHRPRYARAARPDPDTSEPRGVWRARTRFTCRRRSCPIHRGTRVRKQRHGKRPKATFKTP